MARKTKHGHVLGWRRDLPDHRDLIYSAPLHLLKGMPTAVDLRSDTMPDVYDQGPIGSCTAQATAGAVQFIRRKMNESPDFTPSRLFLYYQERVIEHSVAYDAGATIRDSIRVIVKTGSPPEDDWPYVPTPADPITGMFPPNSPPATKPPPKAYRDAKGYQVLSYQRIRQALSQLKACLAQRYPILFGFSVYSSFYNSNGDPRTDVPIPSSHDDFLGGHAVLAVGYSDESRRFLCRNSWGSEVQDNGYFWMPYAYLIDADLAADFWTVRTVEA